ncbi:alpha,alpha-trehalose-phosphate synthase (UDP-forming) [Deinococcus yavapaiensis]|uniref:Trehalose 6-phosphate synthase n=1 Tax=Deinococcus yavapaiensis KR-236 TaxID=694435 RepID=A0A318S9I7_9DEIO|nr:trehalose-6-phosphate synthase [Deinococcus yavapaiensis]PYE53123.1 trehalose 6-phosphate synthase [Deinococcus yavapaiensis KR-236]
MSLTVISNRGPYTPERDSDGTLRWKPPAGGLTAALTPIVERQGGRWVAWADAEPDVKSVDLPQEEARFTLDRVSLSDEEVERYYTGLSNGAIWPVSHGLSNLVTLSEADWRVYRQVNARFAEATSLHEDATVWVQDYQLALVPNLLRRASSRARVGFFWHIPWMPYSMMRVLPWLDEVTRGILGADLVGFHTEEYAHDFVRAALALPGVTRTEGGVRFEGRDVRVEAHPISVDAREIMALAESEEVRETARTLQGTLGGSRVLLGVDRMDYTKGIPERLEAFEVLLERREDLRGEVTLVQFAVPGREGLEEYRALRERVEHLVGRINGRFGTSLWSPVRFVAHGASLSELVAHYLVTDVMLVTPLRDGMNLVAKEFACASKRGVLLLSTFAGASEELQDALPCHPYSPDHLADALEAALALPEEEREARMTRLREHVRTHDVHAWAQGFLSRLAEITS